MNCGDEETIMLALASSELLANDGLLVSIESLLDSNDALWEIVKAIINMKVSDMNKRNLTIIPCNAKK